MEKKSELPMTFYLYLQQKLSENISRDGTMRTTEAKDFLAYYNIPKNLRMPILKEMESLSLIEISGQFNHSKIKIVNIRKSNLLDNTSKLYRVVGCW